MTVKPINVTLLTLGVKTLTDNIKIHQEIKTEDDSATKGQIGFFTLFVDISVLLQTMIRIDYIKIFKIFVCETFLGKLKVENIAFKFQPFLVY